MTYTFKILDNEYWWGGTSTDGINMPYSKDSIASFDLRKVSENQTMPMYLSSLGRCIWSETPFAVEIKNGEFNIEGDEVTIESFGSSLKDAYIGAMNKYFPPCGNIPPIDFFEIPQYNTWMQLTYFQSQDGVMEYANAIIENGFKPGIIMIDEGWQIDYGHWDFDKTKFPDPKAMVDKLHEMGFKVMLWVVPYVRPDGLYFVNHTLEELHDEAYTENLFVRDADGDIYLCYWWNGYSAILDFTKEQDRNFMDKQLKFLMNEYGIDGFKFDGGTLADYTGIQSANKSVNTDYTPAERNIAWNEFGAAYKYHEYKDTFKGGGKRTIQRIRDKLHAWENNGLDDLMPNAIVQGIIGHPFVCPDMVGGGEWIYIAQNLPVDMELFVRMAQCSALFPMMQFSWAPWDALDSEHLKLVKEAHDIHISFADKIKSQFEYSIKTGEPMLRNLEYNYPNKGYAKIRDQFMLGESVLVAPVIKKGQKVRTVYLPEGEWIGFDNKIYTGAASYDIPVGLETLPYFILK